MRITKIFQTTNYHNKEDIILRDYLALERTKLANERTLLSYIRSSLYLLIGGVTLLQIQGLESIHYIGYIALVLTVIILLIGIYRYLKVRRRLDLYYGQADKIK